MPSLSTTINPQPESTAVCEIELKSVVDFHLLTHTDDDSDVILYWQVVEISLQCTLFQRWDGIRIYYPNARMSTEPILNVSRSANRWEGFKVDQLRLCPVCCPLFLLA